MTTYSNPYGFTRFQIARTLFLIKLFKLIAKGRALSIRRAIRRLR